jgi:hypothetical protein
MPLIIGAINSSGPAHPANPKLEINRANMVIIFFMLPPTISIEIRHKSGALQMAAKSDYSYKDSYLYQIWVDDDDDGWFEPEDENEDDNDREDEDEEVEDQDGWEEEDDDCKEEEDDWEEDDDEEDDDDEEEDEEEEDEE